MGSTGIGGGMSVGELAERAGLTVRALHHYDRIGLLTPSARTPAGHRIYTAVDVRRLFAIVALRSRGMPLARITRALDSGGLSLGNAVSQLLASIDDDLRARRQLRKRLAGILDAVEAGVEPSTARLIEAMEELTSLRGSFSAPTTATSGA